LNKLICVSGSKGRKGHGNTYTSLDKEKRGEKARNTTSLHYRSHPIEQVWTGKKRRGGNRRAIIIHTGVQRGEEGREEHVPPPSKKKREGARVSRNVAVDIDREKRTPVLHYAF